MATEDGLAAVLYCPCEVRTQVNGVDVHIVEETDYPFREQLRMTISPARPLRFTLLLRTPAWADGATVGLHGERVPTIAAGQFARLEREWKQGDVVELHLSMRPRLVEGFSDSVSIERGPLVFCFNIAQHWLKLRDRGMTADWQVYPSTRWNYAIEASDPKHVQIEVTEHPVPAIPFGQTGTPVQLRVKARLLPTWFASEGVAGTLPHSPVLTSQPGETISLVPYAAAKLRITSFPRCEGAV